MRKIVLVLATLGLTAAGFSVPASATAITSEAAGNGAAASHCASLYNTYTANGPDGYVRAWRNNKCDGSLGADQDNDKNWADKTGPFRGSDTNKASSVMNTGNSGGNDIVAFYQFAGYKGGHGCLSIGEKYADDLINNKLSNGAKANDTISSHRWVSRCDHWLS